MEYKSKIEEYYFNDQKKFLKELRKFIGYITRKYFRGFKQQSSLYKELCEDIVAEVYVYLLNGHYSKTKDKLGDSLDFRSYLFTQIRGELTKYFNKYNKIRKIEVFTEDVLMDEFVEDKYDYDKIDLYNFSSKLGYKLEDDISTIFETKNYNNVYQIKILFWMIGGYTKCKN